MNDTFDNLAIKFLLRKGWTDDGTNKWNNEAKELQNFTRQQAVDYEIYGVKK